MNWTEGALARHSRGRGWKPELAKQRQYFAKARTGLRGASGPNIASISILPRQPEMPTVHPGKRPPKPLMQSSPHFRRRQSPHGENRGSHVGQSPHQHPEEEEPSGTVRSFPNLHGSLRTNAKRKYTASDEEDLEVKRRRFLQKNDWAGINVPKPVPFHFSARNNLAGNQIWGFRKIHATGQTAPFFQHISHKKNAPRGPAASHSSTQEGDREVRIMIGSEDIRLGSESSNTKRNTNKRPLRTIPISNNYRQSGYFQESSSRTLSQHHASSENRNHREMIGHTKKHLRESRPGSGVAAPGNITRPASTSTSHGRRTRLEHLQRAGHPFVVESSPSIVHHPIPQRLSQLVSAEKLGNPQSDAFGSTIAEVSHNPFPAVPSSEMDENERWHEMFESSEHVAETPDNLGYNRIAAAEVISPGASNFPVPSCPPTHQSSPEYPQESSPPDLQDTPTDHEIVQVELRRNHYESSDEKDDSKYMLKDTVSAIRFSSPLAPTNISLLSDKSTTSDLDGDISYVQGKLRTTDEVSAGNMFDTVIQYRSSSMASASPGGQTSDHYERDAYTGGNTERFKNPNLVLQPPHIGVGDNSSVPEPAPIEADAEWIKFIFGNYGDEAQEAAFQEAREEAARDLRPSSSAGDSYCQTPGPPGIDHDTETTATCGTFNQEYEKKDIITSFHSRSSSGFGLDHIDKTLGRPTGAPLETYNHVDTHMDMAESTIVEATESITQGAQSCHPITNILSTPALESASTMAQPPESEVGEAPIQSFRFARPKKFVGRLASSFVQDAGPIVPLSVSKKPKKRGRPKGRSRKKKAKDGRADIRGVPDHDGDPIDGGSDE